jgi:hypothetical protein
MKSTTQRKRFLYSTGVLFKYLELRIRLRNLSAQELNGFLVQETILNNSILNKDYVETISRQTRRKSNPCWSKRPQGSYLAETIDKTESCSTIVDLQNIFNTIPIEMK